MRIRRREFITLLGGAAAVGGAAAWPLAARAQQGVRLPTIGYLQPATPSTRPEWTAAFLQRLRELGWIEGRTVTIEKRFAEGRPERYVEIAAELVRRKVDVIVTPGTETAVVAKQTTSLIPIVFVAAGDPVGSRLVASLARPGGNVTGLSMQNTDLAGKRLEVLRDLVPGLRRLAILANTTDNSIQALTVGEAQAAALALGLDVNTVEVARAEDIAPAFEQLKDRADALYVTGGPLLIANDAKIRTLAIATRLPTIYNTRESVEAGGLISYGADLPVLYRRSADFVDKILRGTKPGDIPVEQPTKFDLVINLTTAKALGLTIPESFLLRADQVIE
jgi:putative ABC transport system substrate-binding protein